jgi:N utilization substance protein A
MIGAKGSRVRMVVQELRGEKIDIVDWSDEPSRFVAEALSPAKVKEVRIDPREKTALVIVPDYQLSLAIGKEGQNARLAARLTGWRVDIKSESQYSQEQARRSGAAEQTAPEEAAVEAAVEAAPEPAAVEQAVPEQAAAEAPVEVEAEAAPTETPTGGQ